MSVLSQGRGIHSGATAVGTAKGEDMRRGESAIRGGVTLLYLIALAVTTVLLVLVPLSRRAAVVRQLAGRGPYP